MGFQTVLRFGTDISLQGVQSITEEGKPAQICLQGLQCATQYYAIADLLEDGTMVAQSEKVGFQTVACGSMSVTYSSYRRSSCHEHVVIYTYTSTHTPSACVLHAVGPDNFVANYQGIIDSAHGTVTFEIDDWDGGVNYDVYATLYDIYGGEQQSVTTTLTSGTINVISLAVVSQTQTSVTLGISKCNDCGFFNGWVDVWLGTEDPNTDPSDFHEYFNSTDSAITITGLAAGTSYWFKATYTCDDRTTEVYSGIVSGTTAADAKGTELNFTNNSNAAATLWFKVGSYASGQESQTFVGNYKVNNGDWTSFTVDKQQYSGQHVNVATVPAGGTVWLRSNTTKLCTSANRDNKLYLGDSNHTPVSTTVAGNILSLGHLQNGAWKGNSKVTPSAYEYANFFNGNTSIGTIADISGLYLGNINPNAEGWGYQLFKGQTNITAPPTEMPTGVVGAYGMYEMFKDCSFMTTTPDFSGITSVNNSGLKGALQNCSSLTTLPNLAGITRIYQNGCKEMCSGCTSMTGTPVFAALTRVDNNGMELMFENTGLTGGADLSGVTTDGNYAFQQMYTWSTNLATPGALPNIAAPSEGAYANMYNSCFALTAPPRMGHITTIGRFVCDGMFGGCSSLATAPDLTSVGRIGYYGCSAMFMSCTALQTGADIRRATGYDTGMIADMYNGCERLVTAYLPTPTDVNQFWSQCEPTNWLASVAGSGRVIAATQTMLDGAPRNSASGIPANWTGVVQAV